MGPGGSICTTEISKRLLICLKKVVVKDLPAHYLLCLRGEPNGLIGSGSSWGVLTPLSPRTPVPLPVDPCCHHQPLGD